MTVFFHGVIRLGQYQELMAALQLVAQIHGTHALYADKKNDGCQPGCCLW